MAAALPYCDALVSGHSFEALAEVIDAIHGADARDVDRAGGPESRGPARPPSRAARSPCPAARPEPRQHDAGLGHR